MNQVPVGTPQWSGGKNQQFTFINDSDSDVRITRTTMPFPFSLPSPITVKAHATLTCQLINEAGSFSYGMFSVSGATPAGNPKNVIIS